MRDDLRNKQGPPSTFPYRQGNRIIQDRHLTAAEKIARREERALLAKAKKYRNVESKPSQSVDTSDVQPVDLDKEVTEETKVAKKPGRPKKETASEKP